jgi:hypothetical protein
VPRPRKVYGKGVQNSTGDRARGTWPAAPSGCQNGIIPLSSPPQTSNDIIQKGLAFGREQSGTVTIPGATRPSGSCPAGYMAEVGLWWWRQ